MGIVLYLIAFFSLLGVWLRNERMRRLATPSRNAKLLSKTPANVVKFHEAWRLHGKGGPTAYWKPEKPAVTQDPPNAVTLAEEWRRKWFGQGGKDRE